MRNLKAHATEIKISWHSEIAAQKGLKNNAIATTRAYGMAGQIVLESTERKLRELPSILNSDLISCHLPSERGVCVDKIQKTHTQNHSRQTQGTTSTLLPFHQQQNEEKKIPKIISIEKSILSRPTKLAKNTPPGSKNTALPPLSHPCAHSARPTSS